MADEPVLEFPCAFPIKVMGKNDASFRAAAEAIVARHFPDLLAETTAQPSRNERFLSLTFVIEATSREALDGLYRELSAAPEIVMAL